MGEVLQVPDGARRRHHPAHPAEAQVSGKGECLVFIQDSKFGLVEPSVVARSGLY